MKQPILGNVKTRIAVTTNAATALFIYKLLLHRLQQTTANLKNTKVYVYLSGDWSSNFGWTNVAQKVQCGDSLGERMYQALHDVLQQHTKAILIGSDCPYLTTAGIIDAFEQLSSKDVIIGPATDGGYYLIGMQQAHPQLFKEIAWSTPVVFAQTLTAIHANHFSYSLLPMLSDIDTYNDWLHFQDTYN
ncbi:MAG: TIGR04282 family arsenosugar biosynthesis glycosyltransferase [Saprospiraceae bacterium]|nr:TIGR04282 family arsenosugar biosynthesis glycosyltransferase [Saprospiraceae bacterium]MBP7699494.1 TIGR04282 family arsenosugar biosynthesis glycosyltransferase [Saprospiraceae bacterium]